MDKIKDKEKENQRERGAGGGRMESLKKRLLEISTDKDKRSLIRRIVLFALGLIFARCHVLFGSRPLGIVLVALLPDGVWWAALGAALGSLTMGIRGIIYAVATILTVFLRVIISGGFGDGREVFSESLGARMSESVVGGFVVAAYEILLYGWSLGTVMLSASMVLLPPLILFLLSGLYNTDISLSDVFRGNGNVFSLAKLRDTEKMNVIFFGLSSLTLLFFITLALSELVLLGISLAYIFVGFVTLAVAKRLGPLRAMAVGFVAPLGISGIYSVSFALAGLGAGFLFSFGTAFGLVAGGVLLSAWSGYAAGLEGFLTTLPEYLISAALAAPIIKNIPTEKTPTEEAGVSQSAKDMVGTVALKYQNTRSSGLDSLEESLVAISSLMRGYSASHRELGEDEYVSLVCDAAEKRCSSCSGKRMCAKENICPAVTNAEKIAKKLMRGERISAQDVNTDREFCGEAEGVARDILREAARAQRENQRRQSADAAAEEYELISRLIGEVRYNDMTERAPANELNEPLIEVAKRFGFEDGMIRAFGSRDKHFIIAGEDESGERITSKELRLGIEAASGVKLGSPEYYRHGKMALMECGTGRSYAVECASGRISGCDGEISGDSVLMLESSDNRFFAIISDGMGSGKLARDTSEFVVRFLERALDFGASRDTVLHLLNHAMRHRYEECSATIDIFELDLLTGDATFIKSGAAPSFVKRDSSIFRIKSQTAPIGLMSTLDSERIRVEIKGEDYVIMLSDGVLDSLEESTWLLELLSRPPVQNLKEYCDIILTEAKKHTTNRDDMSVIASRITRL